MKSSIKLALLAFGAASLTGLTVLPAAADGDTTAGKNNSTCRDVSGNKAMCLTVRREGETVAQWQARENGAQALFDPNSAAAKAAIAKSKTQLPDGRTIGQAPAVITPNGTAIISGSGYRVVIGPNGTIAGSGTASGLTTYGKGGSGGNGGGSHVTRGAR